MSNALYGSAAAHARVSEDYQPSDAYANQGDTRVVRDLSFAYMVGQEGPDGVLNLIATEVPRNTEVSIEQIGLIALEKGERYNSFYTDKQLERMRNSGTAAAPAGEVTEIGTLGEHELAEWLTSDNPETGRAWTINEVLEKVGDDKDLANRMLAAENIATDGDPRSGLEAGLTKTIESSE